MPGRANMANGSGGLACLPPKHVFPFPTGLKRASLSAMTYLGTSPPVAGCTARRTCRQRYGERRAMAGSFRTIYLLPHRSPISNSASFAFAMAPAGRCHLSPVACREERATSAMGNVGPWLEVSEPIPSAAPQPHIQLRRLCLRGARKFETPRKGCRSLPVLQRGTPGPDNTRKATALSGVWPVPHANICAVCRGIQNACIFILSMRAAGILFANAAKAWQNLKHNRLP